MACQANIGAVLLTKALRKIGRGNLYLMRSHLEKQRIHDTRHVARHALAGFRVRRVAAVFRNAITVFRVTPQAHFIWLAVEFQRRLVGFKISEVG